MYAYAVHIHNSDMPNVAGDTIAPCLMPTNWNIIHWRVAEKKTVACQLFIKNDYFTLIYVADWFFVYYKKNRELSEAVLWIRNYFLGSGSVFDINFGSRFESGML